MITAIDPDLRKSGVCRLDSRGNIMFLSSCEISTLIVLIQTNNTDTYVIEDVNKIKAMYNRGAKTNNNRIAQNVGMCKGVGTVITDIVKSYAINSPIMAPVGIGKQVKKNAKLFTRLSGWGKSSNEDMRDAWAIARWHWLDHFNK